MYTDYVRPVIDTCKYSRNAAIETLSVSVSVIEVSCTAEACSKIVCSYYLRLDSHSNCANAALLGPWTVIIIIDLLKLLMFLEQLTPSALSIDDLQGYQWEWNGEGVIPLSHATNKSNHGHPQEIMGVCGVQPMKIIYM